MAGRKKTETVPVVPDAEIAEAIPATPAPEVSDAKVEEIIAQAKEGEGNKSSDPPGHPSLWELKTDPTAINRVRRPLTEEEMAATAACANSQVEVANPEDRKAAKRFFMAHNLVERALWKLTKGELNMEKMDSLKQEELDQVLAQLVQQRAAQVQQAPQQQEETPFFQTTTGTVVKYGAAMAGGAALAIGATKLFGGESEEAAALALGLFDSI